MSNSPLEDLIQICLHTFKQYEYNVKPNSQKEKTWHIEIEKEGKKYLVLCIPEKVNDEIFDQSIFLDFLSETKKANLRPVVVSVGCRDVDKKNAEQLGFCLLDTNVIQNYYEELSHALEKEYGDDFLFDPLGGIWPVHLT